MEGHAVTVSECMALLAALPPDARCGIVYDGGDGMDVANIYLANSGRVVFTGSKEVVYYNHDRPVGAPSEQSERYWHTPE